MVKSYLRYEPAKTFGVISSSTANAIYLSPDSTTRTTTGLAIVPANDEILAWDIKTSTLIARWSDPNNKSEVTALCASPTDPDVFAAGYLDGSVRVWDRKIESPILSFNGHRAGVSVLRFDREGIRLASAGRDNAVVVWDLVGEVGLWKLKGHSDWVTGLEFVYEGSENAEDEMEVEERGEGYLLTTGKDGLLKVWDLSTQHCVETHMAHTGECWGVSITPDKKGFVTIGNEGEVKVWELERSKLPVRTSIDEDACQERGSVWRTNKDRAVWATWHSNGQFLAVNGQDKSIELFRIRTEEEVKKVMRRKKKRKAEKLAEAGAEINGVEEMKPEISDIFVSYVVLRTGGKVRSVSWVEKSKKSLSLLAQLTNNSLEYYDVEKPSKDKEKKAEVPEYNKLFSVELPGHRTDVRALSLSSDDRMLASASSGSLKIWNVKTGTCIRTFECGYALCCSFLPGDGVVVVGTKAGELELFDVASATMLSSVAAHEGSIWSLQVSPDGRSLCTGSADKNVKFWEFKVVQEEIPGTKRTTPVLRLNHTRTVKLSDDVLSVRFTPNGKYLAVSLLDNTVKVLFTDTLKLFQNLYGHKLPVLNMDISSDSKLIATCSADKNVKLWGLDFGDCHKSFFAHQDSIMSVVFARNSHNFFSASKDRVIKYYDGDKFEQIQKIDGHFGEIWALAAGRISDIVVSASHDKSIRVWEQGEDQIFLEEEREKEMDELYEATLTASLEDADGQQEGEVEKAGKQTRETMVDGEKVIEALDLGMEDLRVMAEYREAKARNPSLGPPQRNILFTALGNISAERHVLNTLQKIKAAHLQDALLLLPFEKVTSLLTFLNLFAQHGWNIPLTSRILHTILRTYHKQIVATKTMREVLDKLRFNLREALKKQKDEMGYNLAALRVVKEDLKAWAERDFVDEDEIRQAEERARKKRGFANLA